MEAGQDFFELSAEIDRCWRLIAESRRLLSTADRAITLSNILIDVFGARERWRRGLPEDRHAEIPLRLHDRCIGVWKALFDGDLMVPPWSRDGEATVLRRPVIGGSS
jgi:hypothetical protein